MPIIYMPTLGWCQGGQWGGIYASPMECLGMGRDPPYSPTQSTSPRHQVGPPRGGTWCIVYMVSRVNKVSWFWTHQPYLCPPSPRIAWGVNICRTPLGLGENHGFPVDCPFKARIMSGGLGEIMWRLFVAQVGLDTVKTGQVFLRSFYIFLP